MISSLAWVPRGRAAAEPKEYVISEEERALAAQLEGARLSNVTKEGGASTLTEKLDMERYDDEDAMDAAAAEAMAANEDATAGGDDDDVDSDAGDRKINPQTDALLLAAVTEEDFSSIEVHVFDETNGSLFVHHDIALPAMPLSLAWVGADNLSHVAVGTFLPLIEVWNLDVMDVLEPAMILGGVQAGAPGASQGGPELPGGMKLTTDAHTGAVMSLSWNRIVETALASGSADHTVKVWDLSTQKAVRTFEHHKDKVNCVLWHPVEESVLASGSFDKTVRILDSRMSPNDAIAASKLYSFSSDIESLVFNPHNPAQIVVATEDGAIAAYDMRAGDSALFSFKAHSEAVSSLSFSSSVRGLLSTASSDKTVRVWDYDALCKDPENKKHKWVASKEMNVGQLFDCSFYGDSPFLLASAGSEGSIALWDCEENAKVEACFKGRVVDATSGVPESAPAPPPAVPSKKKKKRGGKKKKKKN